MLCFLGLVLTANSQQLRRSQHSTEEAGNECWNASLPIDKRLDDLLSRMTLEEKAGQMYHARALLSASGQNRTREMITDKFLTHFV